MNIHGDEYDWEYDDGDGDLMIINRMNRLVDIHLKGHYTCRNHQKSWIQKITNSLFHRSFCNIQSFDNNIYYDSFSVEPII